MTNVAIILGVSAINGLGTALANKFSKEGMSVVIAGRTQARLEAVAEHINTQGGNVTPCVTDATDANALQNLMAKANQLGTVKAVVFNIGHNQPLAFENVTEEQFESFWRISTLTAFLSAQAALPTLKQNGGSLLFTGASASMRGKPNFGHFSAAKAGLRNLAQALAKEYGPQGVHVGHIVVDGVINGESVQSRFEGYIEKLGEDGALEPDAIAEAYWFLHTQHRSAWTFEIDVRPFKEPW